MFQLVARPSSPLLQLDLQHLLRVVPLVEGGIGVEAFITLQADEPRLENPRQDLGDFGLADTGFAFEKIGFSSLIARNNVVARARSAI